MQKIIFCIFLLAGLLVFSPINAQIDSKVYSRNYTYETLSFYQKNLFDTFLDSELPQDNNLVDLLTDNASLRTKTRLALALLFRNAKGDKEKAATIIRWILDNQYQDESTNLYGIWKTSVSNDRFDQNWREFIGCDLIVIRHKYRSLLPQPLIKDIEAGLVHAAKGALKRNVGADYTNISMMSAFLMEYVGTAFSLNTLQKAGIAKAQEIFRLYQTHKTFSEYNSPTYYGVTLIGLALWRELSYSGEMQSMGKTLEQEFWQEIATFYNSNLKNMPGPFFRGYGMDMSKYFAITGIWIALALDDERLAPVPAKAGPKYGEISNLSTILHLGLSIPEDALNSLKSFSKTRYLTRNVPNKYKGDSLKNVSVIINSNWMMGGLWGNKRVWEQIKIGTIHWKTPDDDIGWVAITGDGHTNVKTTSNTMSVYTNSTTPYLLQLLIYSPDLERETLSKQTWHLSGIELKTRTSLKISSIEKISNIDTDKKYAIADAVPYVYKVVYEVPPHWNIDLPLLEITPDK